MLILQVALVSDTRSVTPSELTRVAAALQKQAVRDFAPIWEVRATVDPFVRLEDVPIGYWPIIVRNDIKTDGAAGVHLDKDSQPFALVQYDESWSLTASHECLEMLADPFGNRLIAGKSVKRGQGRVEYLVEVCDPSEAADFAYTVNGVTVSDFFTPNFFDPQQAGGVRYSYTGAIKEPRQVLRGGYLSWHHPPSDHWWQLQWFGAQKRFVDLDVIEKGAESIRAQIDRTTSKQQLEAERGGRKRSVLTSIAVGASTEEATGAKAVAWKSQIRTLLKA
jgi:hypothetical protein